MQLWEILVPCSFDIEFEKSNLKVEVYRIVDNNNRKKEAMLAHHKRWDEVVRKMAGGLTILKSAKGHWVSEESEIFIEDMIPVRIACSKKTISKIAQFTKEYYKQKKVMFYQVSEEVHFI